MTVDQVRLVRVAGRRDLTARVFELELESIDGTPLPAWEPGAHIDVRLGDDLIRQYSLVPSATGRDGTWTIAVLIEPEGRGGSVRIAAGAKAGAEVKVSGPRNHFALTQASAYWFIAGGIGITPIVAMCAAAEAAGASWALAYLGRSRDAMPYLDDLLAAYGADRVVAHVGAEGHRLDIPAGVAALPAGTMVFACGPERLLADVETSMPPDRLVDVRVERFHPRDETFAPNVDFTVLAVRSGVEFLVPHDESILVAADFEGIEVPGDCLEGTCGSCETPVLRGEVEHRDSVLDAAARRASRSMMICVSRAAIGCPRLELDL